MEEKLSQLSFHWSFIDGQGFVCVVPIDSFKTGFILLAQIGPMAEGRDYYPELTLARSKVTITIDDSDADLAVDLAKEIDTLLPSNATD